MFVGILIFGVLVAATTTFAQTDDFVEIAPYIVNGTDAMIEEFPFMVSIRRDGNHTCGGSLLNSMWILTAAHCLTWTKNATRYTVQYQTNTIENGMDAPNLLEVGYVGFHSNYTPLQQFKNDIGLVQLKYPLESNVNFRVKLPMNYAYTATGTPSVLIGWGRNATMGTRHDTLQKVDLQIFNTFDCAQIHDYPVFKTSICAGVLEGGKGQCSGDSGGPLLVDGVQVGIVSWSIKPCGVAPYPGVFTEVSHYIEWIEENTGINLKISMFKRSRD